MMRTTAARGTCLAAVVALLLVVLAGCDPRTDTFRPVTRQGDEVSDLFLLVMVLSGLVFLLVAGLLVYAVVRFPARPDAGEASRTTGNRKLEIVWTAIPAAVLAVLFILAVRTMNAVGDPGPAELRVEVVGHQWWWEYRYPDLDVVTANELHLPVGRPVRLELAAADVIHSFGVPRFGWKLDAIPGKTNRMSVRVDEAGVFDGGCMEFCGAQHAWMRIRVVAEPQDQFDAWVQRQQRPAAQPQGEVARAGQDLFLGNTCVNCHTVKGTAADGTVGPDLTHFGSRETLGAGIAENTSDNLAQWVRDAKAVKPEALMPSYPFTDEEIEALVRYLEGLT